MAGIYNFNSELEMVMQEFEKHEKLSAHILRMASTGSVGSPSYWDDFISDLNDALLATVPAMPIPKQEPAVAVPEPALVKKLQDIWWRSQSAHSMRERTAIEIINTVRESSPRITEQDAREIINHFETQEVDDEWFSKWLNLAGGRALLNKLNANAVAEVRQEHLRYTSDGALAECPCCGSLDVGGAHNNVHCYKCGLNVTAPVPLKNAIDIWNRRTGAVPAQAAAIPEVTPEMLAAAQKHSKLGGYACSNFSGGYAAITELFNVMQSASPKPE